jgi:hypothetical protein
VYGHHPPDHLRAAARALGYGRRPNHWPKHWPAAALIVGRRRNMPKLLVRPGEVPRRCDFNDLECKTYLPALTSAKGIFLHCQTRKVATPITKNRSIHDSEPEKANKADAHPLNVRYRTRKQECSP